MTFKNAYEAAVMLKQVTIPWLETILNNDDLNELLQAAHGWSPNFEKASSGFGDPNKPFIIISLLKGRDESLVKRLKPLIENKTYTVKDGITAYIKLELHPEAKMF